MGYPFEGIEDLCSCQSWKVSLGVSAEPAVVLVRIDETYVKVKGRWRYLYRAIDKDGATLDFFLSERRSANAAKRFLGAALKRSRDWIPRVISTDKNPAYGEAIAALKKQGTLPRLVCFYIIPDRQPVHAQQPHNYGECRARYSRIRSSLPAS
jgi:transposase-like protein